MFRARTFALVAIAPLLIQAAHAKECHQFVVPSTLEIEQSNGYHVTLQLTQDETGAFSGTATYPLEAGGVATGNVRGSIGSRGKLDLLITWESGSVGDYTAWVTQKGKIVDGTGFDRSRPESRATWKSPQTLQCAR